MHVDKARKLGAGLAGGAVIVVFGNFMNMMINAEGSNPQGIFTFLYTTSIFAVLGSVFMIFGFSGKDHHREKI